MKLARDVLIRIDVDPASCEAAQRVVGARRFYTKDQNGLLERRRWAGRVFLNFPFSQPLPWIKSLLARYEAHETEAAIVVCNARPSSRWFRLLSDVAWRLELERRARFWGPHTRGGNGRLDNCVFYLGTDPERFRAFAKPFGRVIAPAHLEREAVTKAVTRRCAVCHRDLSGMRLDADVCSGRCRVARMRARRRAQSRFVASPVFVQPAKIRLG